MACEVFLDDINDPVLLFHGSFGFREVGQHVMPNTEVRAAMLMKELCSFAWIHEAYGEALPKLPWIAQARAPCVAHRATGTCL